MLRPRLVVCLGLLIGAGLYAHKFHAGLAMVEWNGESRRFEVAFRVFVEDLETSLSQATGQPLRLDQDGEKAVFDWVRSRFRMTDQAGRDLPMYWVGLESDVHRVWLYFEVEARHGPQGLQLVNTAMTELFPNQVNTVNLIMPEGKKTLIFNRNITQLPLTVAAEPKAEAATKKP